MVPVYLQITIFQIRNSKWITNDELKQISAILIVITLFSWPIYTDFKLINGFSNSFIKTYNHRDAFYEDIGKWFNEHTNRSESIETVEIGIIGYYSKNKIIDGAGLIQPEIAEHFLEQDLDWSINEYKPDYILFSPMFIWVFPLGEWVEKYHIIEKFTVPSGEWYIMKRGYGINDPNTFFSFIGNLHNATVMNMFGDHKIWIMDDGNEMKYTILEHPNSTGTARIIFNGVFIPENTTLEFAISLDPLVWSPDKGDGVNFSISISNNSISQTLFSKYIDPKTNKIDRIWHKSKINLIEWSGQNVSFVFETSSGPGNNPYYDWALWGNPILIKGT